MKDLPPRTKHLLIVDGALLIALLAVIFIGRSLLKKADIPDDIQPKTSVAATAEKADKPLPASAQTGQDGQMAGTSLLPEQTAASAAAQPASGLQKSLEEADLLAAGYDYDAAIEKLKGLRGSAGESDVSVIDQRISKYEKEKSECVAVDPYDVPHIFYHSLITDTTRAFDEAHLGRDAVAGWNAWMTTIGEFDKITQRLYDNGFVYVRLRDLVVETKDADGTVHFEPNYNLMLPPGKKAIVLSVDDLSYYHTYADPGFPNRLVLDENGDVKCEYTDAEGNTTIGDYDVVPRLNTFIKNHPDASYRGARGLIAMTGYNGVFGYRTDADYELRETLQADQEEWLEEHPDFNRQEEIDKAIPIANAIKEEGWEFASHTWGHQSVTHRTAEQLAHDNQLWVENVENIVGPVDTIIFAHGNDIADDEDYDWDNEKYAMFKEAGYDFYCNVDASQYAWIQIRDEYVRSARINVDGFTMHRALLGETHIFDDLFGSVDDVIDPDRPDNWDAYEED